eukprot:IDg21327t1
MSAPVANGLSPPLAMPCYSISARLIRNAIPHESHSPIWRDREHSTE